MKPIITLYSTPWCSDCHRTKAFLKRHGIPFNEISIEEDAFAEALVRRQNDGRRRVPTLLIDGTYYGNPSINELGRLLGVS